MIDLRYGDCLDIMPGMAADFVDAIVTDPPYGLTFMGKDWDKKIPDKSFWGEILRVAKPGAHMLTFGGTRTFHRLACAIEDAGWQIRDTIMWVYGSGFPKSLDVSKAIDKAANAKRTETIPVTDAAHKWVGWGTALKPAWEPIILVRKPLDSTVAQNVQRWGTGALNIDGCRIGVTKRIPGSKIITAQMGYHGGWGPRKQEHSGMNSHIGRWPANVIHDGSEEVLAEFAKAGPRSRSGGDVRGDTQFRDSPVRFTKGLKIRYGHVRPGDSGTVARFFYCPKASRKEREMEIGRNEHPTVKPVALMRYLCRLITPPGGIVFDPFMGTGSTGIAAILEGFSFIGIELSADYVEMAERRIAQARGPLFAKGAVKAEGVKGATPLPPSHAAAPLSLDAEGLDKEKR